jgi:flagellar biosynthesis protein FlhB
MDGSDKDSKTEQPTEKRVNDALEEGNTPVSREVPLAISIIVLSIFYSNFVAADTIELAKILSNLVDAAVGAESVSNEGMKNLLQSIVQRAAVIILPLFASLMIAGIVSSIAQNEPRIVLKRIMPKYSRISFASGWKRMNSASSYADFIKSTVKLTLFSVLFWLQMSGMTKQIVTMARQNSDAIPAAISALIAQMLIAVSAAAAAIAVIDLVWQRRNWLGDLKMTLQEVKDEMKQSEGDPIVKGRLRALGRSRARNRMMKSVPSATLIIANPTHIAIALRYDRDKDAAPVVVAAGADLIALRIREIAAEHAIPVVEQIDLARALYKAVRVDQIIPPNFYKAVAVIIREISDLKT